MTTSESLSTVTLSRTEVVSLIRTLHPMPSRSVEAEVDCLSCIQLRDAIEFYARLRGARSFLWRDPAGETAAANSVGHNALCLARDAIAFPFVLARYRRLIAKLAASAVALLPASRNGSARPCLPRSTPTALPSSCRTC